MQQSHWYLKLPSPFLMLRGFPKGTKPRAKPKPGHKKHSTSSKQPSVSRKEATKVGSSKAPTDSKTGHLKRKKESSLAMDSNPSQTSASTLVVAEVHKEDQQATGGPTFLGVTSEARANPQLSSDQTKSASEGLETVLTQPITGKGVSFIARQVEKEEASSTIKLEDLAKLVSNVLILQFQKHKLELEKHKAEAEAALLKAQPSFPNVGHLNKLLDLPSKFNKLTEEAKLKTLDALPSLLNKVTNALNHFAQAIASKKTGDTSVLLAGHAGTQPAEEEKNTNQATIS
ncbi:hypothetical protein Tco_0497264 [Tanacetum coccineum]